MASELNPENYESKDPLDYIQMHVKHSVFLPFTDANKILRLLSKLDINKGSGYDLISNRIIKSTSTVITPYLVYLYNLYLANGIFPDSFKIAQVIPLFKGVLKYLNNGLLQGVY